MYRIARFLILAYFCTVNNLCIAQDYTIQLESSLRNEFGQGLRIGELVPDVNLGKVVNRGRYFTSENVNIKLKYFKGKYVILDFWNAHCGSCIQQFPKIEDLQGKLSSDIIILPIGFSKRIGEDKVLGSVQKLIQSWKGTFREMKISSTEIIEEPNSFSSLRKLFPFQFVPTLVWINKDGKLCGISSSRELTESNLIDFMEGNELNFKERKYLTSFSIDNSFLFKSDKSDSNQFLDYSITTYIDSFKIRTLTVDSLEESFVNIYSINNSVFDIYNQIFSKKNGIWASKANRIKVEIDSNCLLALNKQCVSESSEKILEGKLRKVVCVHARYSTNNCSILDPIEYFKRTVDYAFGIESTIENRLINCLVLRNNNAKLANVTKNLVSEFYLNDDGYFVFKNYPINEFIEFVTSFIKGKDVPIISNSETNTAPISISFDHRNNSIENIQEILLANGYSLEPSETMQKMIILNVKKL